MNLQELQVEENVYKVLAETPQPNEITRCCPMAFAGTFSVSPLCHTGFNSAKQLVRTTNTLIDSSEVNESKLLTLFTSFAELKATWMLREGTGNQ